MEIIKIKKKNVQIMNNLYGRSRFIHDELV